MVDEVGAELSASVSSPEMISKAEATELIKKEKMQALDKARREYEELHQREMEKVRASMGMGGMPATVDADDIADKAMSKLMAKMQEHEKQNQQAQLEAEMQRIADSYRTKMGQGEQQFEDFKDVMSDFNPASFPQLVYLVSSLDSNAAAVMRELVMNPVKLSAMNQLAVSDPKYALKQLQKIGQSVAVNQEALENNVEAPAPLNRPKPTASGSTSGGQMTLADLKKAPWLRKR